MKNLITLLLILPLFAACSSDDDNNSPTQDYTSIVVWHDSKVLLKNAVVGYYTSNGSCKKISELGDLEKGEKSKEIIVSNEIKSVYIFSDYPAAATRTDHEFILEKNKRNELFLNSDYYGTKIDKDSDQYPH